jgi:uncharacterized protein YbbC (DUF1343 family)
MPHFVTVQHYPGACLIEGTTLSEGRGTALPFEIVGAPYLDSLTLAEELNSRNLEGVRFRPHMFQPAMSKYAGEVCGGVQAHIINATRYQPIDTWLYVISTIRSLCPDDFAWLPPYDGVWHFDRLIGSPRIRQQINEMATLTVVKAGWRDYSVQFHEKRQPFIYYR